MDQPPRSYSYSYEQDFLHIIDGAVRNLRERVGMEWGNSVKRRLRKVEIELDEADDIVSQLETEIQGIPKSIQSAYTTRLKSARADLNKYKRLSKDLHSQAARSDLLGSHSPRRGPGTSSDDPYGERSDRERLLVGTETLDDGSRRIQDSTSLALQTETYGAEILTTLRGQREQIENSRNTLDTADRHIDRASGTLTKMIRQMYKQRVILGGIIASLWSSLLVILYFKLFRR
ncbi:vesicle transport v-snare protein vti1 [Ephemerocybe angulata]|uniref:Vesicle transport v-snare protein vti1 n=1 Tax=Ephemerocybe angulata TaxID=980116 RepID=A0A8H6HCJ8_9AGAR|nr:vesicle transport v-snare protein vti1 [Tulosesus angulatus]